MRRSSSCSKRGWNAWETRFASRTSSSTSRWAFACSRSRSRTTSSLAYFSNISSLARWVAFTTALMRVTRSLPSSSSRIPSIVQPGGVVMCVRGVLPPADAGHARSHLARRVGHGPDYRSRCREEVLDEAGRNRGGHRDDELRWGHVRADLLEQLAHVLRLHGDDDHVRSAHRRPIVGSHRNGPLLPERLRPLRVPHGGDCVLWRQTRFEQPLQQDVPDLAESQYRHTLFLHRRYSSSRVAASVFSSRYFTITGVYSEMPQRAADAPGAPRAPGTTTAPAGISSGRSPSWRYT